MTEISSSTIIAAVLSATQDVFSTMLNLPIEPGPTSEESCDPANFNGVVALVAIAGDWVGSGRISCSSKFACQLAAALMMCPVYEAVNEEVLDGVGEVSNMIVGNVKTFLEETLGGLALGIPTVVFGHNYSTRSANVVWNVVPFHSGDETIEVRFCLMPKKAQVHPHPRPEHQHA
jgi:CheY-specific phosphatase CheX